MTGRRVTYLSMDSLDAGVGASQVRPYVQRFAARGLDVMVHSFEPDPAPRTIDGVTWRRHAFGRPGAVGGLGRIARAAAATRGADLLHARSDLAAAAALLARPRAWVWDMRSFWADQRIDLGMLRPGSPEERALRKVERWSARSASAIITLAEAAIPVLGERHGAAAAAKAVVVPTCVDLDRFALSPMPTGDRVRLLLSGSLNRYYDVPLMLRLHRALDRRRSAKLIVLAPGDTPWDGELAATGAERDSAPPDAMPTHIAASHVGLSVCRRDVGVSLKAATPTKLGELLACGRPVVVNAGIGDMDALVARHSCGVVLDGDDDAAVERAADELLALLEDPSLPHRCRAAAEAHFDLDAGVDVLVDLYRHL